MKKGTILIQAAINPVTGTLYVEGTEYLYEMVIRPTSLDTIVYERTGDTYEDYIIHDIEDYSLYTDIFEEIKVPKRELFEVHP